MSSWQDKVTARGFVPSTFPDGPSQGDPAARYIDAAGHPRYALPETAAPDLDWNDKIALAALRADAAVARALPSVSLDPFSIVQEALSSGQSAGESIREKGKELLTPPWWLLPAVVGFAGLVVYQLIDSKIGLRRR